MNFKFFSSFLTIDLILFSLLLTSCDVDVYPCNVRIYLDKEVKGHIIGDEVTAYFYKNWTDLTIKKNGNYTYLQASTYIDWVEIAYWNTTTEKRFYIYPNGTVLSSGPDDLVRYKNSELQWRCE